jgi:hypothetical protein
MITNDNGGPAFPAHEFNNDSGDYLPVHPGMTLRDYFAGQALAGMCSVWGVEDNGLPKYTSLAGHAYAIAEAMLAERKRRDEVKP